MKKIILLLTVLSSLLITACDKGSTTPDQEFYLQAKRNSQQWDASYFTSWRGKNPDTIMIQGKVSFNNKPAENLFIMININGPGTYKPIFGTHFYISPVNTDVVTESYHLLDENNTVTITDIDTKNNTIKGSFKLAFGSVHTQPVNKDKLRFTQGTFNLKTTVYN